MQVLTVKLDDQFAAEIEHFRKEADFANKSEMVRDALKLLMVEWRKNQLQVSLERYLQDEAAQVEAADLAEANMILTEEALQGVDDAGPAW
jgi:Arc/MetJ-type ribon-helix-helix transcriptional regulator